MSAVTTSPQLDLAAVNAELEGQPADAIVRWAAETFSEGLVMSTSFGVQAAVMLHLVTRELPGVPVIFIDTGFHFLDTYRFADQLAERLKLNLKVYQAPHAPAWTIARHGKLWETGNADDLDTLDRIHKVEPMNRALDELGATAVLAGLRRGQTEHRKNLGVVALQDGRYKVHPIIRWSGRDVHDYLKQHDLPYHPLREQGYASIGDWYNTLPITAGQSERDGRFGGLKQECGLHIPQTQEESQSRDSSAL